MKSLKKLIPAICMLLVAAMMLGTSTFAWFSMNNKVSVTGMQIRTQVGNNLFIASSSNNADGSATGGNVTGLSFGSQHIITMSEAVLLEPVSTTTGFYNEFFYTDGNNATDSGAAINAEYNPYSVADKAAFNQTYGLGSDGEAVAYADYVVVLQAYNAGINAEYVNLTKATLTYAGSEACPTAFRVAVLVQDADSSGVASDSVRLVSILAPAGAEYFSDGQAVISSSGLGAVQYLNSAAVIGSAAAGTTTYFKVTLRIWIEGEDTDCYNRNFVELTKNWALDAAFELQKDSDDAVEGLEIASTTVDTYVVNSGATLSETKNIGNTEYYVVAVEGSDVKLYATEADLTSSTVRFYKLENTTELFEVTYQVTKH